VKNLDEKVWPNLPVIASGNSAIDVTAPPIQQVSPVSLAYIGDAVYELYIRTNLLLPLKRSHDYHQEVVALVRAETQAQHLQALLPKLTDLELALLKRGRNAASGGPRRLNAEIYRQATSFETLIGYLYLTDPLRLRELLAELNLTPPAL
jgi:ribonuclease III family protein